MHYNILLKILVQIWGWLVGWLSWAIIHISPHINNLKPVMLTLKIYNLTFIIFIIILQSTNSRKYTHYFLHDCQFTPLLQMKAKVLLLSVICITPYPSTVFLILNFHENGKKILQWRFQMIHSAVK